MSKDLYAGVYSYAVVCNYNINRFTRRGNRKYAVAYCRYAAAYKGAAIIEHLEPAEVSGVRRARADGTV